MSACQTEDCVVLVAEKHAAELNPPPPSGSRSSDQTSSQRVGRPRASQMEADGPVREQILIAARRLFRDKGFKGTSTREIAQGAGLRQPSLFHYFKSKAEIFRSVAMGTVQPVLDFVQAEKRRKDDVAVSLYRLVYFDTYHLCTNENVLGSPFQFPELTEHMQPEFWQAREAIIANYRRLLRAGMRRGVFDKRDLEVTTHLVFSLGESTLTWYRGDVRRKRPEDVANAAAEMALRTVLKDAASLAAIVQDAAQDAAGEAAPEAGQD